MKRSIIFHIGAHRTGTTALQEYLKQNDSMIAGCGYALMYPPITRRIKFDALEVGPSGLIFSDENLTGYMEENIDTGTLYPHAYNYMKRVGHLLNSVDLVYFTIRRHDEYWQSAISFCLRASNIRLPSDDALEAISRSTRGWFEVIFDIASAFPSTTSFHVREFCWKTDNPKRQLINAAKLPILLDTKVEKRKHNARPSIESLVDVLVKRHRLVDADKLRACYKGELFSSVQKERMRDLYVKDLRRLSSLHSPRVQTSGIAELEETLRNQGSW